MVPGATAAFSLDPSRVSASVEDGLVTLIGRGPGSTNVVVIAGDQTASLRVVVGDPPLIVLPGMRTGGSDGAGTGFYEARYGSDPGILQGNLLLSRRQGDRSAELSLGGAAPLAGEIGSPFSVPLASFTLRAPNREMTVLDRVISNSPLTISRSNIRGVYLQQGPWRVNAGYTFFSSFENLLLPTNKEGVVGVAYRQQLGPRSSLTPNLFYFDSHTETTGRGPLGTIFYEARPASDVKFVAELGASRSLGGAVEIEVDRPRNHAWAKLRLAPPDLPSLTTDHQSGRQLEAEWSWQGEKSALNTNLSSRRYLQGTFDQSTSVANLDVRRQLTPQWMIHGGSGLSLFENGSPSAPSIHSLAVPVGTSLFRQNVGLDVDYQFSRETTRDLGGHLVRASLHGDAGGVRLSIFGERQTQAPTARQILTDLPWLQSMLDRLGLAAETPQQLADLFRTNAELSSYGYANRIQIDVTPIRTRLGVTAGWSGAGMRRPQLFVSTLFNRDEWIDRTSPSAIHSVSYSQRLDAKTEMFFTWSALCRDRFVSSSSCHPVLFASLRQTLDNGPGLLMPSRGHIDGIVFKDDLAQGLYTPGLPPLADVDVVLDDVFHAKTDSSGRFRFDNVSYGRHRVEARYVSQQPTFFTTPSPADVDTNTSVNFGIAVSRSSLRGVVRTDAGLGLPGVLIHIANGDRRTTARTADDGSFIADGLASGMYDVIVDPGSVPAGYPLDGLRPQRIRVEETAPGRASFVLRAYRSVAGQARLFNRESGQYVPLAGATVELQPAQRRSVTDANGQYAFRDLAAGEYTITAKHDGREYFATVSVPDGPALLKNIDLSVLPAGTAIAGARSTQGATGEKRALSIQTRNNGALAESASTSKVAESAANGWFTIRVAASATMRYARAMVSELIDAGYPAYLVEPGLAGAKSPYRVCIGKYSSLADADQSARHLETALGWRMSVAPLQLPLDGSH